MVFDPDSLSASRTISALQSAILSDAFTFVVNGREVLVDLVEAIALSPAIQGQLQIDSCANRFVIDDSRVNLSDLSSLRSLLSDSPISFDQSSLTSLLLLSRRLCNTELEHLIILSSSFSDLNSLSTNILSQLSFDALDDLLSSPSLQIESEDALLSFILNLGSSYSPLLRHIQLEFLSSAGICQLRDCFATCDFSESLWCGVVIFLTTPRVDSLIISDIPPLFDEFRDKKWELLWRGNRDGFRCYDFHSRCDGHANTLTLIQEDPGGWFSRSKNIFGAFTPVEWDSENHWKGDDSLKSFLFTLKNPHNIPARKFALEAEEKQDAIFCNSVCGPSFYGMWVSNNCNANTDSYTNLGPVYTNDTGLDGKTVFTGSRDFKVKEIEVFEITD
jgi:hypothetical protein